MCDESDAIIKPFQYVFPVPVVVIEGRSHF